MEKKTLKKFSGLIVVLLLIILSACQSGGDATNIKVELTDFAFNSSLITIPAGEEITLKISNSGIVPHNFIVMQLGMEADEKFDDTDGGGVYWEVELQPGETRTVMMTAPDQPGVYQILCGMPGHLQAGMVGRLEVVKQQ